MGPRRGRVPRRWLRLLGVGVLAASPGVALAVPITQDLVAHYDASQVVLDAGSRVQLWTDLIGGDNHATQSTAGDRPTVAAGVANGHDALRFDGANHFLVVAADPANFDGNRKTWFIVASPDDPSGPVDVLLRSGYGDIDPGPGVMLQDSVWGTFTLSGDAFSLTRQTGGAQRGERAPITPGQFSIITGYWDGDNANQYLNGLPGAVQGGNTGADAAAISHRGTSIGANFGAALGSSAFDGDIAEVLIYNEALTPADRVAVENDLALKYGFVTPSDAPITTGLIVHLDASHLTADAGGAVHVWNNRAQGLHNAIAQTPDARPMLLADALNGRPGVAFDGVDDLLTIADHAQLQPGAAGYTIFLVADPTDPAAPAGLLGKGDAPGGAEGFGLSAQGGMLTAAAHADGDAAAQVAGFDADASIVTMVLTGSELQAALNGDVSLFSTTDGDYTGAIDNTDPLWLGRVGDSDFDGVLFELLIYDRALSLDERFEIEQFLGDLYDIDVTQFEPPPPPPPPPGGGGDTGVPEPATVMGLFAGVLAMLRRRRRCRRVTPSL